MPQLTNQAVTITDEELEKKTDWFIAGFIKFNQLILALNVLLIFYVFFARFNSIPRPKVLDITTEKTPLDRIDFCVKTEKTSIHKLSDCFVDAGCFEVTWSYLVDCPKDNTTFSLPSGLDRFMGVVSANVSLWKKTGANPCSMATFFQCAEKHFDGTGPQGFDRLRPLLLKNDACEETAEESAENRQCVAPKSP